MKISLLFPLLACSACCGTVDYPIGVPERPELVGLTPEEQAEMSPQALLNVANDYARLKGHIQKLEARIILHDENL